MEKNQKLNVICDLVVVSYDYGPSLSSFVARVEKVIKADTKVKNMLTPMGTILEGEWSDVMNLINTIFMKFAPESERLGLTLKVDFRKGKDNRMEGKVKSVENKM